MPGISSKMSVIALDVLRVAIEISDERANGNKGKWGKVFEMLQQIFPSFEQGKVFASPFDPSKVAWYEGEKLRSARLGKWIRKEFPELPKQVGEDVLEMVSTVYGEAAKGLFARYNVQLLFGYEIPRLYSLFNEVEGLRSCMTKRGGELVQVYAKNPERVSLAVVCDEKGSPLARALFWKAQTPEGQEVEVLDRVYYSELGASRYLKAWALARGAYVKERDEKLVSEDYPLVSTQGTLTKLHVTLEADGHEIWPYMDTFRYLRVEGQRYVLSTYQLQGKYYSLDRADGFRIPSTYRFRECATYRCRECGEPFSSGDDTVWYGGEPYCEDCFSEHFFHCGECGEAFPWDYGHSVDGVMYCEACFDRNFSYCVSCERPYSLEYLHFVDDLSYCDRCFDEYFFYCEECGDPYPVEDGHVVDGLTYCEACFQERFSTANSS